MPKDKSALDSFLQEINTNDIPLKNELDLTTSSKVPEKELEDEDKPKNRRIRRLEDKLEKEREANIALNERVKTLSEFHKFAKDNEGTIDPDLVQAFGTTEDGKALNKMFSKKFEDIEKSAEERALKRFEEMRIKESEDSKRESEYVDTQFDALEDKFGIDLSGGTKVSRELRNNFIDFVSDISPKNTNGEIVQYADFEKSFETFQKLNSREKPREISDRQKELASRTMVQSGQGLNPIKDQGPMNFKKARQHFDSLFGN